MSIRQEKTFTFWEADFKKLLRLIDSMRNKQDKKRLQRLLSSAVFIDSDGMVRNISTYIKALPPLEKRKVLTINRYFAAEAVKAAEAAKIVKIATKIAKIPKKKKIEVPFTILEE